MRVSKIGNYIMHIDIFKRIFMKNTIILQGWVTDLDLHVQSSLISVVRGNDTECKESKNITKMLRYIIVKDAGKKSTYMSDYIIDTHKVVGYLVNHAVTDKHFVEHIIGAGVQISRHHPDVYVKAYWRSVTKETITRIRKNKVKERKRVEHEKYINSILDKYTDIYTKRYI